MATVFERTAESLRRAVLAQLSMAVHRTRSDWINLDALRAVPQWCGCPTRPGVDECDEWRVWTFRDSTFDQLRIEAELDRMPIDRKRLLHVGVGNSNLARRFANRLAAIDGITIQPEEVAWGRSMRLPGYRVLQQNKFAPALSVSLAASYDYIVDNNPSAFACCATHFLQMIDQYSTMLREGGRILTDRLGLEFSISGNHTAWQLNVATWQAIGAAFGLTFIPLTEFVMALERPAHGFSQWKQIVRRFQAMEGGRAS